MSDKVITCSSFVWVEVSVLLLFDPVWSIPKGRDRDRDMNPLDLRIHDDMI